MNLSDDQLSALLRDTAPAPRLRPAEAFWADTLRRAREEAAREAAHRRFARRSRFAAAAAAAIIAAAGLFAGLSAAPAPAPGSAVEDFELTGLPAAGAAVLADADSSAQILWILTD